MNRKDIKGRLDKLVVSYNQGRYEEVRLDSCHLEAYMTVHVAILKIFFAVHIIIFTVLSFIAGYLTVVGGSSWNLLVIFAVFVFNSMAMNAMDKWKDDYKEVMKYLKIVREFRFLISQLQLIGNLLDGILTPEDMKEVGFRETTINMQGLSSRLKGNKDEV